MSLKNTINFVDLVAPSSGKRKARASRLDLSADIWHTSYAIFGQLFLRFRCNEVVTPMCNVSHQQKVRFRVMSGGAGLALASLALPGKVLAVRRRARCGLAGLLPRREVSNMLVLVRHSLN